MISVISNDMDTKERSEIPKTNGETQACFWALVRRSGKMQFSCFLEKYFEGWGIWGIPSIENTKHVSTVSVPLIEHDKKTIINRTRKMLTSANT